MNEKTLRISFENIVTFYKNIEALLGFVSSELIKYDYILSNRSGKDTHFFYDTSHNKDRPEEWISNFIGFVFVKKDDDKRKPDKVLFFKIVTNFRIADEPFKLFFGVLQKTFLEKIKKKDGKNGDYWDYQKLFKQCKFEREKIKYKNDESDVVCLPLFTEKDKILNSINRFFGDNIA